MLNTCKVTCEDNGNTITCEVLERTDKRLKVVIPKTTITVSLTRQDLRKNYIGHHAGMTFASKG